MNAKLNKEEGGSSLFTPIQCHVYAIERKTIFLHGFMVSWFACYCDGNRVRGYYTVNNQCLQ